MMASVLVEVHCGPLLKDHDQWTRQHRFCGGVWTWIIAKFMFDMVLDSLTTPRLCLVSGNQSFSSNWFVNWNRSVVCSGLWALEMRCELQGNRDGLWGWNSGSAFSPLTCHAGPTPGMPLPFQHL